MSTNTTTIIALPHLLEPHPYTGELITLRHVAQVNSVCQELKTLFRHRNRNRNRNFPKPSVLKRRTNNNSPHSDSDHTETSEEEGERVAEEASTPVYDGYVYSTVDYFGIPKEIPRLYNPETLDMDEYMYYDG
ncbi:uncharacterized protein H6S33_003519 [Morchella sextelata]|jgi:hypothetical protein|uniref:uncharacterized protein n=1 Tax=Morchella sextelata TaxID=1174677 RepID=UPI001D046ADC|nr:uncharacterized protein H6S33_003519 [Morchella sextelata]KAH0606685.1 hypothetical protein H6S33_003519 [Morchella sextelata]